MVKKTIGLAIVLIGLLVPTAFADVKPGDRIITLGNDLTNDQKTQILNDFSKTNQDQMITVTHADEENALQGIVPDAVIGTKAISSGLIVFGSPGSGIQVKTKNITWVSNTMYENALLTAGIKDAAITVEAPFPVSGTAGLAGITKAFETATGQKLDGTRKQVANEEMVQTAKIGQSIGNQDKAAAFLDKLKERISQENPKTDDQYRQIIEAVAKEMGINLTPSQINSLIDLLKKIEALHIDWGSLAKEALSVQDKINNYIQNNPQKANAMINFFESVMYDIAKFIKSII